MKWNVVSRIIFMSLVCAVLLCAEPKAPEGLPFAIISDSEARLSIEPYVTPTFQVTVISGKFPQYGPIWCKAMGPNLKCNDGLTLGIERITFHAGDR